MTRVLLSQRICASCTKVMLARLAVLLALQLAVYAKLLCRCASLPRASLLPLPHHPRCLSKALPLREHSLTPRLFDPRLIAQDRHGQ